MGALSIEVAGWSLRLDSGDVERDGAYVAHLSPRERDILGALMLSYPLMLTARTICHRLQHYYDYSVGYHNYITCYMARLRAKLGRNTIRGQRLYGYQFSPAGGDNNV